MIYEFFEKESRVSTKELVHAAYCRSSCTDKLYLMKIGGRLAFSSVALRKLLNAVSDSHRARKVEGTTRNKASGLT